MTGIEAGKTWSRIGPEVAPTSSSASGVWTLQEYSENQGANSWPNPTSNWVAWFEPVYTSNTSYQYFEDSITLDVDSNDNVAVQFLSVDSTQTPQSRYTTVAYINGTTEAQTWGKNQGVNSSTTAQQYYITYMTNTSTSLLFDSSDELVVAAGTISLANNDGWKTVTGYNGVKGFLLMNWNKTNGAQLNYSKVIYAGADNAYVDGGLCKGAQTATTIFSAMKNNDVGTLSICQTNKSDGALTSQQTWSSPSGGAVQIAGGGGDNGYAVGAGYAWTSHGGASQMYHATYITNVPGSTSNGDSYNLYITSAPSTITMGRAATMSSNGAKMYCAVYSNSATCSIVEINTSTNAITWQRSYRGTYGPQWAEPYGIVADASGNTYTIGRAFVDSNESGYAGLHTFIMKHNSSGVLQWTRILDFEANGSHNDTTPNDISIDAAGEFIYVGIYAYVITGSVPTNLAVAVKLATDGSGTGTTTTTGAITKVYYYDAASYVVAGFTTGAGSLSVQANYMNNVSDYLNITNSTLPQTNTAPTPRPLNLAGF